MIIVWGSIMKKTDDIEDGPILQDGLYEHPS